MRGRTIFWTVVCAAVLFICPFVGKSLDVAHGGFIFWQLRVPRLLMALMVVDGVNKGISRTTCIINIIIKIVRVRG